MEIFSTFSNTFAPLIAFFGIVGDVWYIIFPPLLFFVFKEIWMDHVQDRYIGKLKWINLEIIAPRELEKSPLPMEMIFAGFAGVMKTPTAEEVYIKGELPAGFSMEIVGTEGNVRFFVRTQVGFRNLVEAHFYAQYPDIEIVEAEDYVHDIPVNIPNNEWDLWGCDFEFVKPDHLYPIRTYKNFEESITGKMLDPLASVVEVMSKLGPGEHIWHQIIAVPYKENWAKVGESTIEKFLGKEKKHAPGVFSRLFTDIGDVLSNLVPGLLGKEVAFKGMEEHAEKDEAPVEFRLTPGQKKVLEALEVNNSKQQFQTRMRFLYIAKRESWKKPFVSAFVGAIKQFNDFTLNAFKPGEFSKTYANYLWIKPRTRYRQRRLFNRYIKRDPTPGSTLMMLSTEELATIFHIPDMSVASPMLSRVAAKRGGAPANLPMQDLPH